MKKLIEIYYISTAYLVLLLIFMTFTATAEVYKWTDENGKIHYSDKPIDEKTKKIKMKRQPSHTEVSQAKERASALIKHKNKVQEITDDERHDKKIADRKDAKDKRKLSSQCRQAKREIILLGKGRVTYTTDEDGERHYLSDEEKNQSINQLKKDVKEHCQE